MSDADVTTCRVCGGTLFRTNIDGHWHHRDLPDDGHDPEPAEDKPPTFPMLAAEWLGTRTSAEAAELYRQAQVIDPWPEGDYR